MKHFLLILSCLASAHAVLAVDMPPPKIAIVFGDSITQGNMLAADQRDHLWTLLVERRSEGRLKLENEGKGGRPTASLPEFDSMLQRRSSPDLLVIALGGNDSRDVSDACVPKAVANIRAMIERSRKTWGEHLPVLLVGPTNINKEALVKSKPIADAREAKLKELNAAFEALAKESSCEFVTLFGVVPSSSLLMDGVHPDAAGNELIAQTLFPVLATLTGISSAPKPAPSATP